MKKNYTCLGIALVILALVSWLIVSNKKETPNKAPEISHGSQNTIATTSELKVSNIIPNNHNLKVGEQYGTFVISKLLTEYNPEIGGQIEFTTNSKININGSVSVENFEYKTVRINSDSIKGILPTTQSDERGCALTSDKKEVNDIINSLNDNDKINFSLNRYVYDNRGMGVNNVCYVDSVTKLK